MKLIVAVCIGFGITMLILGLCMAAGVEDEPDPFPWEERP